MKRENFEKVRDILLREIENNKNKEVQIILANYLLETAKEIYKSERISK